jgi:hypothetical protein
MRSQYNIGEYFRQHYIDNTGLINRTYQHCEVSQTASEARTRAQGSKSPGLEERVAVS